MGSQNICAIEIVSRCSLLLNNMNLPFLQANDMTPVEFIATLLIIFGTLGTIIYVTSILAANWKPFQKKQTPINGNATARQDAQAFQTLVARLAGDNLRLNQQIVELKTDMNEWILKFETEHEKRLALEERVKKLEERLKKYRDLMQSSRIDDSFHGE